MTVKSKTNKRSVKKSTLEPVQPISDVTKEIAEDQIELS